MIYELIYSNTPSNCETNISIEKYTKAWVEGSMSNYDYLIALNEAANRTRNDLSQYPVFPWILSNYTTENINFDDSSNFRDLCKPIGALDAKRLESFKERYLHMPEPKFLYGTHYSNPAYVIGYLFRKHPNYMIKLHGGRFDHPDRLFNSIDIDWKVYN
jgi:factor associated with neutral sphingomyelinase activation